MPPGQVHVDPGTRNQAGDRTIVEAWGERRQHLDPAWAVALQQGLDEGAEEAEVAVDLEDARRVQIEQAVCRKVGDQVLDMAAAHAAALFSGEAAVAAEHAAAPALNGLMALGPSAWQALRLALSRGLREGAADQARWARGRGRG